MFITMALGLSLVGQSQVEARTAQPQDACPLVIRVRDDGNLVTWRFSGWRVTSTRTLASDLRGGCYNDSNPSKVTSVSVTIAKGAPAGRLNFLFELLTKNGWPREKVRIGDNRADWKHPD